MSDHELRSVVCDLIIVLHEQAKQLESLVSHIQGMTSHLPEQKQFSVVASELSELQHRIKLLTVAAHRSTG
jgi:hypothetical protein